MAYFDLNKPQYDDSTQRGMEAGKETNAPERFVHLKKDIEESYKNLEWARKLNENMVKEYAGPNYGTVGENPTKYLNKLQQAVDAYMITLAANRPQVLISTQHKKLSGFARHFQTAMNNFIGEIKIENTIRRWVLDAFLCVGLVKAHMADAGYMVFEGDVGMDPGIPFASNVLLDDWVHDSKARSDTTWRYAGDMYQIPFQDLQAGMEMGMYEESVAEGIRPSTRDFGIGGDGQRVDEIGVEYRQKDDYAPVVDLADIWIPRDGKIYTFHVTAREFFSIDPAPLSEMTWEGPEEGPYFLLGFTDMPGRVMPVSPASHLEAMDRLINNLMRKSSRQARRQKDNPIYSSAGAPSMERLHHSSDSEPIQVDDVREIGMMKSGGVDPGNQAFLHDLLGMYDEQAGNLTAMLGLGAQSDTVGQEQLIHSAGSRKGGQMQYRVLEATTRLISCLGSMLWKDGYKEIAGTYEVPGKNGEAYDSTWKPGDREGTFLDYNFDINVHSMSYQPPAKKIESINMLLTQVYIPMMQAVMEQGGQIDFMRLTEIYADLLNLPRLKEVVTFSNRPYGQLDPQPSDNVKQSPVTHRNYTRRSIPSGMPQKKNETQQQTWASMAGGQQNGQNGMSNGGVR